MKRALRWYDTITVNIYFLGLTTVSQTNGLVLPLLVQGFVGEAGKGGFFGTLRLWTLMVALLVQAAMGMLSDRSSLRWGRRRPFIFTGTLLDLVFIAAIGFSAGLEGMYGYWLLFAFAILLQVSSNIAQSAQQGLIPDLVPEEKRGLFSGIKALFELPLPLLLVSFTIARLISAGNMLAGLLLAAGVLTLTMLVTLFVPEKPLAERPPALDWAPFLRLVLMTALFTAVILGSGQLVKLVGRLVQDLGSNLAMFALMGLSGLGAMAMAVALGVWMSVRISLGEQHRQHPAFVWWVINRLAYLVGAVNLSTFAVYFIQARLGYVGQTAASPAAVLMLVVGIFILLSAFCSSWFAVGFSVKRLAGMAGGLAGLAILITLAYPSLALVFILGSLLLLAVFTLAAALPEGWLAERSSHKRMVALSGIVASLGTAIALLYPSLQLIYIGGTFIGVATGIFFSANWALGTELVPKEEAARFLGISNLAGAGAGAVGAYIGGPIADYFTANLPQSPGLGYVLLFGIYGVLFLLSVAALSRVQTGKDLLRASLRPLPAEGSS